MTIREVADKYSIGYLSLSLKYNLPLPMNAWKENNLEITESFEDDNVWAGVVRVKSLNEDFEITVYSDNGDFIMKSLKTGDTIGSKKPVTTKRGPLTITVTNRL